MFRRSLLPIAEVVDRLTGQAVRLQQTWDDTYKAEVERQRSGASELPPALQRELAPTRLRLSRFELETRLVARVEREFGFELRLAPVNLGFAIRHRSSAQSESAIKVEVEQVPVVSVVQNPQEE